LQVLLRDGERGLGGVDGGLVGGELRRTRRLGGGRVAPAGRVMARGVVQRRVEGRVEGRVECFVERGLLRRQGCA
jgi:hypothetical protein